MDKFNTSLTELKSPARYAIFVGYKVDVNPEDYQKLDGEISKKIDAIKSKK